MAHDSKKVSADRASSAVGRDVNTTLNIFVEKTQSTIDAAQLRDALIEAIQQMKFLRGLVEESSEKVRQLTQENATLKERAQALGAENARLRAKTKS